MRHFTLLTRIMIVLMVMVVAAPDLFHHVAMPLTHSTAGDASSHESTGPHDPVACSILHAGHGCHFAMQPHPIDQAQRYAPKDLVRSLEPSLHVAAMAADIFHPPRT